MLLRFCVCSSCSPPVLLLGVMLSSQQGFRSSLSCFHCVGLQHFGEWPVLRSLSRLRLLCFEARLSGCCVREGGVKGVNPGFLVLAFSTRIFESSGVPARRVQAGGASAWACLWLVALLHVRGSWSSWVFRAVHCCCFLGSCSALSKSHLVVKLHCVGLQHFGEREGLLAALGSCKSGCPSCFADASERGCQS